MGLLSKPSRRLLLRTLQRVQDAKDKPLCSCRTAFEPQCVWCDLRDLLVMEERGKTLVVEASYLDSGHLRLRGGREVVVGFIKQEELG